jgi:hypothetical protein
MRLITHKNTLALIENYEENYTGGKLMAVIFQQQDTNTSNLDYI